jgi:hypothetical protein
MTVSAAGGHVITAADPPRPLRAALKKINSAWLGAR